MSEHIHGQGPKGSSNHLSNPPNRRRPATTFDELGVPAAADPPEPKSPLDSAIHRIKNVGLTRQLVSKVRELKLKGASSKKGRKWQNKGITHRMRLGATEGQDEGSGGSGNRSPAEIAWEQCPSELCIGESEETWPDGLVLWGYLDELKVSVFCLNGVADYVSQPGASHGVLVKFDPRWVSAKSHI